MDDHRVFERFLSLEFGLVDWCFAGRRMLSGKPLSFIVPPASAQHLAEWGGEVVLGLYKDYEDACANCNLIFVCLYFIGV